METRDENTTQLQSTREQFLDLTKDALEHLYDLTHLEKHPFAQKVKRKDETSEETRGLLLQKDLVRAIDMLDSGPVRSSGASPSRRHNIMRVRYVERLTIQNISYELGISERQIHRDLRQSEEDLATILWSWYEGRSGTGDFDDDEPLYPEIEQLQTHFQTVDISQLIFSARSSIEQLVYKWNVEVVIDVPPEPVMISTDPFIAKHVFINLFSASVQKSTGSRVNLALKSTDDKTVLNLFFTETPTCDSSLFNDITLQLIHRLKWEITQTILPGSKCCVELSFGKNMPTVLVIDDYEGLSRLLKRYLAGYRCRVLAATDGVSGLSLAREAQPDAIVLDVMMPGMDGWEILQRLHNHPATQHIPVIICSVFNDPELAYALGASAFLSKPVKRDDILKALRLENDV